MTDNQESPVTKHWQTASELPTEIFAAWRKPDRAISPVAVVTTVDPDGAPRAALFGSLRAITPRLLRLACLRYHDTYVNLSRDGRVTVVLVTPPDIAVSVRGRARVVRERMITGEQYAFVEIEVEEVKNDMVAVVAIESTVTISARDQDWLRFILDVLSELEET